jgi:hypothetical protein
MPTLFEQPMVLEEALFDLREHIGNTPIDESNEAEWEQWGQKFLGLMVSQKAIISRKPLMIVDRRSPKT